MMIKFALFTTAALVQGQEVGDSGRRPLNVDNFESQEALDFFESLEDFDSSTPDYMADYNSALDNYDGTDYSYDGTALNSGRPSAASNNSSNNGVKTLNLNQLGGTTAKPAGYNQCRSCNGLLAADCATAGFETCNDAQEACQVEIRSQYKGGSLEHRYYSRCTNLEACRSEHARNFYNPSNHKHDQCKTSAMAPRFFQQSKCTICTQLGNSGEADTILFGSHSDRIRINGSKSPFITALFADPDDATDGFAQDFYNNNDHYTL